jgi:hypothetical protein
MFWNRISHSLWMENTERELHAHHLHRSLGWCGTNAQNISTNSVSSMSVINTEEYGTSHNCVPMCSYSPTTLVHIVDLHSEGVLHIICWLMNVRDFLQFRQTDARLQHSTRPWLLPSAFGLLTVFDLSGSTCAVEIASLRNEWPLITSHTIRSYT